jgi:two-component system, OmpR family, phosphate regulon sensor histidine kinase PhoR
MKIGSRGIAILLALSAAFITLLFLSLFEALSIEMLALAGLICFSVTYILTFIVMEFLIFREINKIYRIIEKLRKRELSQIEDQRSNPFNPLKGVNEEIFSFAQLKQKEIDELKKLESFRKEFIADISHELKTPIFAAQGFVHTLIDGAVNDKAVRMKFLKKAAKSLDGLDLLVQDLLTLSQIETGDIKMHFENIDLHKLTEEIIDQFEGKKSEKKEILFKIEGNTKKAIVYADWQRMYQVLTNLISNAIKYSPETGKITITFHVTKKHVITKVRDEGEGISSEHINRIFERFYRVDKSRSRERGGTGLGLAIVKHIMEGHGSKVEVESEPGKGSVFSFKLPRASENPITAN